MTAVPKAYPDSDLDTPLKFLGQTGSFWSRDFRDKDTLESVTQGRLRAFDQTQDFAVEVEKLISRFTAPITHRERWIPITFTRNASGISASSPLKYGEDKALYGEAGDNPPYDTVFEYGGDLFDGSTNVLPIPAGVVNIRAIMNRVTDPSVVMVEGVNLHLLLDEGVMTTDIEVFNDPRIGSLDSGNSSSSDKSIRLWAYGVEYDRDYIWKHFGYVVGTRAASSSQYKGLVNAIWDSHVAGSNKGAVYRLLSAVMDVPYALEDGEVVEHVLTSPRVQVITDKNVYTVSQNSNVVVGVGDVLTKYQGLTDTVSVQDLRYIDDGLTSLYSKKVDYSKNIIGNQWLADAGVGGGFMDYLAYFDPPAGTTSMKWYNPDLSEYFRRRFDGATPETLTSNARGYGFQYVVGYASISAAQQNGVHDIYTVNGLGDHNHIRIRYKFLPIGKWRGNTAPAVVNTLIDGVVVNTTTFSNMEADTQAYPGGIGDSNPAFYGASRVATDVTKLWHPWHVPEADGTAEYTIELTVPHTAASATLAISVSGLDEDEWVVTYPTPARDEELDITTGAERYYPYSATPFKMYRGVYTSAEFESRYGFAPDIDLDTLDLEDRISESWYRSNAWRAADISITPTATSERLALPRLNPAQVDNPDIPGITLGPGFLPGNYFSGIYLANKEVDLEYIGVDDDGFVEVRFELSGYPGDIEEFWQQTLLRGKEQGYTLANYLDRRPNPVGQPAARHLPAKVNPMLLVLRHIMGYNLFIIKLRAGLEGDNALSPAFLGVMRKILPPHTAFIIFTEINVDTQEFDTAHYETLAIGSGAVITELGALTADIRPPAVTGVALYI